MNERDSYELRRIRRENERQTSAMIAPKSIALGGCLILVGLVSKSTIGIIMLVLGILLVVAPIGAMISNIKEEASDKPKRDRIEVIRPKSFDEEPENTEEE